MVRIQPTFAIVGVRRPLRAGRARDLDARILATHRIAEEIGFAENAITIVPSTEVAAKWELNRD